MINMYSTERLKFSLGLMEIVCPNILAHAVLDLCEPL